MYDSSSIEFLFSPANESKSARLGLERMRPLAEALGRPLSRTRLVHVAGTNGKGSTCVMIESALRAAGLRTGMFTSPHLQTPLERIRLNGEPISRPDFQRVFERVCAAAKDLVSRKALDSEPTYFETLTAMALLRFEEARVNVAVVEVGMGGGRNATNVVEPAICVITPIDFDHETFLGSSLDAIAREKAGILKAGVPAVFSRQRPETEHVLLDRASALGVSVTRTEDWSIRDLSIDARASHFLLAGERILHIQCPLAGEHQVENAVTAVATLERLRIPNLAIEAGIAGVRWPGRLERVSENPEIILDGAHNPAGARALAAYIDRYYSGRAVRMVYGAMRNKAVAEMAGILFPHACEVVLTAPRQARAISPETLKRIADHPNVRIAATIEDALASGSAPPDATFVTGSLFLVAEARAILAPGPLL